MRPAALLTVALGEEADIVAARQRARQIAALLGFESQDQTRIATAVSEIARNAVSYGGGGRVEFAALGGARPGLRIVVRDSGPGIADVQGVLDGRVRSANGMGVGISGTRRLMDDFAIVTAPGAGTAATLSKLLPHGAPPLTPASLAKVGRTLAATGSADPLAEMRTQNQELLHSLAELKTRQDEARRLNTELEVTNRGVVALYAELDEKAGQLAALNAGLETRVAEAVAQCQQANNALRQSQKMEAVGQLTGGIAHDFNNLLQIVIGNLELIGRRLQPQNERLRRATDNAMSGAQRAATLTQRLLAFSRKQPLAPRPVHPNQLVESLLDLLGRTLGETVKIETNLARDVWIVEIDANQLENALLNLAVNARDAMQPGGTLTITTANGIIGEADGDEDTVPGQYVSVAIRDNGMGMSGETMAQAFEPFFTTKEAGKGTGLGLSMVFGFTKQSGGHVRIESSLGRGTTVTLYLPRFAGQLVEAAAAPDPEVAEPARAEETILVVEDDADVRAYSCEVLRELGYRVLLAVDGPSAVSILDGQAPIDLLFTDVVLSGPMNGREVADHAIRARPGIPVLFTSGYARDAIVHHQRLDAGADLLAKPFSYAALAAKVGERLRARVQPGLVAGA